MKSVAWLMRHDLSLTFDEGGNLWRFRPRASAHGTQPVHARMDGADIVVAVEVAGVRPGDMDVHVRGDVLEIRGIAAATSSVASDVGLPVRVDLHSLETAYDDGVFEVRVPTGATIERSTVILAPAAV